MADEKKVETPIDETSIINTEELRDVISEKKEEKLPWYKKLFRKKAKKEVKK